MEKFIAEIYAYSQMYTELKLGILETRQLRMAHAEDHFNKVYKQLCDCCRRCLEAGCGYAMEFTQNVLQMSELKNDLRILSDHVERYVLPLMLKWISECADIDVETEEGYRILSSNAGYLTVQLTATEKYIHSAYDPMEEARIFIGRMFEPVYSEYIVYGCGMGYYAYQLYKISYGAAKITIYERDAKLLAYARQYGVLDWVPDSVLDVVIIDDNGAAFLAHNRRNGVKAIFHTAELDLLEQIEREELTNLCIGVNTSNVMRDIASMNYYRNREIDIPDVIQLKGKIRNEAIVVAAGPSLDMTMDYLRHNKGKKTIIAVNTIFRKLVQSGIKPDFVVVIDASDRMEKHLAGMENEDAVAVLDLCAYWRWTHDYKGPKYRMYSTYGCREAKEYIEENKKEKWLSGGTVTFSAMEFAYRMGAEKIYFVGVDMGYPEGKSHASGTAYSMQLAQEEMFEVEAVGGGNVLVDYVMNLYRRDIEFRIAQIGDKVKFYNLSTIGARIRGTVEIDPRTIE